MLFSTVLSCELARTFWNAGMAIAASRPMMTTTIMISTRVKPLLERIFFIGVCILLWIMYDNRCPFWDRMSIPVQAHRHCKPLESPIYEKKLKFPGRPDAKLESRRVSLKRHKWRSEHLSILGSISSSWTRTTTHGRNRLHDHNHATHQPRVAGQSEIGSENRRERRLYLNSLYNHVIGVGWTR